MIAIRDHEAEVAARFDLHSDRFKTRVEPDDVRLTAVLRSLEPIQGLRILDLGCGKGRFSDRLEAAGACVTGLDLSVRMLSESPQRDKVRGSASRLPFATASFDAIVAVEVFEHLPAIDATLREAARVLRPGGRLAVIDKNAGSWNTRRPWLPNLAIKWLDEKRGLWMYPSDGPVRERWFWPRAFARALAEVFEDVRIEHPLSPAEADSPLFRRIPSARLMTLWTARATTGDHLR